MTQGSYAVFRCARRMERRLSSAVQNHAIFGCPFTMNSKSNTRKLPHPPRPQSRSHRRRPCLTALLQGNILVLPVQLTLRPPSCRRFFNTTENEGSKRQLQLSSRVVRRRNSPRSAVPVPCCQRSRQWTKIPTSLVDESLLRLHRCCSPTTRMTIPCHTFPKKYRPRLFRAVCTP